MDNWNDSQALQILEAARTASQSAGVPTSIAMVDAGGNLVAFLRLDGALLASVESAQVKARTALFFGTETRNLPAGLPITPALLGCVSYPVAFVPGGIPVRHNGRLVGAIGVGGGTGEQDHAIAVAAAGAVQMSTAAADPSCPATHSVPGAVPAQPST